jgi:hypothetical protein
MPISLFFFLSVRRIVGDRHSRADFLVAAYFRAGAEVNVPHLFPLLHRDLVTRERDDLSSHLGSLCECSATKRERLAAAIAMRIDFIFIMAFNPGISQTQVFMGAVRRPCS